MLLWILNLFFTCFLLFTCCFSKSTTLEAWNNELLDDEIVLNVKPSLWGSNDNRKISNPLVSLSSIMLRPKRNYASQKKYAFKEEFTFPVKPPSLWGAMITRKYPILPFR